LQEVASTLSLAEQSFLTGAQTFTSPDENVDSPALYFIAGVKLSDAPGDSRVFFAARQFPPELTARVASIDEHRRNFHNLSAKIKRIKATYVLLLAAVALLLIFAASWMALYL
jgi:nitrogen fixation/metabolism regulation signal transduction histidine kinase